MKFQFTASFKEQYKKLPQDVQKKFLERLSSGAVEQEGQEEDMELRPGVKKRLLTQMEDAKQGKNISPTFTTVEDVAKWLES